MLSYRLTKEADADIEEIARYTISEWGTRQAERYLEKLVKCFEDVGAGQAFRRKVSEQLKQVFVTRCEHHYVFYFCPENERPVIIAVWHERMDAIQRLKARL